MAQVDTIFNLKYFQKCSSGENATKMVQRVEKTYVHPSKACFHWRQIKHGIYFD